MYISCYVAVVALLDLTLYVYRPNNLQEVQSSKIGDFIDMIKKRMKQGSKGGIPHMSTNETNTKGQSE